LLFWSNDVPLPLQKKLSFSSSCGIKKSEIVISIKDRGTGIDPEIHDKLFTIFVTKSETGSGLGLFISKGVVEAHGGKYGLKIMLMKKALHLALVCQCLIK
jgi:signal transduction histidine kinase